MSRRTRPGSIQSVVQRVIAACGGIEAAALEANVSLSTLSYGTEVREDRPGGLGVNHLDRLARIEAAAARELAQHFSVLGGGVFQPVDLGGASGAEINRITAEFSDVLNRHVAAHSEASDDPGDYTPAEAAEQVRELDELIAVSLTFRALMIRKAGGTA